MIPVNHDRSVVSNSDDTDVASFGISRADEAHIMTVLRATLYSDKHMAVLREYGANAWDAHREAGKLDVPIKITLPTLTHPVLEIRDYGLGLSRAEVMGLFTQYGASTKRASNSAVGMLGIGSKSGFAYADSFTIISRNAGKCSTYVAVIDASERGEVRLLDECDTDDTGLAIQIGVKRNDIGTFCDIARKLFKYMEPRPEVINLSLDFDKVAFGINQGAVGEWIAVMGCVPYPIDLNQLEVPTVAPKIGGVIRFDIGALAVSASRESLKYTDSTKAVLEKAITEAIDSYVQRKLLELDQLQPWQRRIASKDMNLFGLFDGKRSIPLEIAGVTLKCGRKSADKIDVDTRTRIVYKDDKRNLKGFSLTDHDIVARSLSTLDMHGVVCAAVVKAGCEGLPIVRTSQLAWHMDGRAPSKPAVRAKHRKKAFEWLGTSGRPYSGNWKAVEREPQANDVYVELNKFHCPYVRLRVDVALCRDFDYPMPTIYGYKKRGHGIPYSEWSAKLAQRILEANPALKAELDRQAWADLFLYASVNPGQLARIESVLGKDHPLATVVLRAFASKHTNRKDLSNLAQRLPENAEPRTLLQKALALYPLLREYGASELWGPKASLWFDYIKEKDVRK